MTAMLLSIKPMYARAIFSGEKEYEFRKRRCRTGIDRIVFYSSSPVKLVVGEAEIERIIEGSPSEVWEIAKYASGITRDAFYDYYHGCHNAVAYKLKNVLVYKSPKVLADYGIVHAPQSYVYITGDNV